MSSYTAIQSMTGFGSAERSGFRVEMRSLNHRFMDMNIKLPPALSAHDMPLRGLLKERFKRGKIDVYVSTAGEGQIKVNINRAAAKELLDTLNEFREEFSIPGAVDMATILGFKGLFMAEEVSYEESGLYEAFGEAVRGLEEMRVKEGEALISEISSRAETLEALNNEVVSLCPSVMEACRKKYAERLRELLPGHDEARLLHEASEIAGKADISEEVTRFKNHLEHMGKILSTGGTIGRKLDFLLQELNREANTIASKADDYNISKIVVEMKAELEKTREQVQNIQ